MLASLCPKVRRELRARTLRDAERFRLQCPNCNCLVGLGGAAFHFDTTLSYAQHLSRSKIEKQRRGGTILHYSGLERALGSFERADALLRDVFDIFIEFGLPEGLEDQHCPLLEEHAALFVNVDLSPSKLVTVPVAVQVIDQLTTYLTASGVDIFLDSPALMIDPGTLRRWRVRAALEGATKHLHADNVVVAVGKSALRWMQALVSELGLAHTACKTADVGVRLETAREKMAPLMTGCPNPRLAFLNGRGESVRTFCITPGGRVMYYNFAGIPVLEGQHFFGNPTRWSNIGIVTALSMEEGVDGTEHALEIGRRVSEYGGGQPVVQTVGDLFGDVPGPGGCAQEAGVGSSLIDFTAGDLRKCMPASIVDDVASMIELLNTASPGCVQASATVAAPVIERVTPSLELSTDLESSAPGIYVAGDCSSKFIGITYGAAAGLAAARSMAGVSSSSPR
ncbi:MAG TPA: hypothetical protein VG346_12020 [Acidimicrobiales bacterium]|jgi:hypothetical protein|nr:hypothetical protein [Acidimicrobiales bacterium]